MSYVAYGPLGPKPALAVSTDLTEWTRLGPVQFAYQPDLDTDLNLFPNKDVVHFPEPVPGPGGEPSYAMLHRPMWDLGWFRPGEGVHLPAGLTDERPGIWISYVPVAEVEKDISALARPRHHKLVALSAHPWEDLKIGAARRRSASKRAGSSSTTVSPAPSTTPGYRTRTSPTRRAP